LCLYLAARHPVLLFGVDNIWCCSGRCLSLLTFVSLCFVTIRHTLSPSYSLFRRRLEAHKCLERGASQVPISDKMTLVITPPNLSILLRCHRVRGSCRL
jgi:hypothetical protein